jgi:hypothetical protein
MRMARLSALAILLFAAIYVSVVLARTAEPGAVRKAVVVELFTSEGCSSCPPADELLGHLRQDLSAKNIEIIPLGFHVDYWNSLGWKDRFSSAAFSQRQERYARSLGVDGPYTPQMVVDGASQFVGSDSGEARRAISQAASQPELAGVKIAAAGTDQVTIQVKAPSSATDGYVMMAITEDNLTTQVGSGENGGHILRHAAVVRELRQLGRLHSGAFEATVPLNLDKGWKRQDLRAVAFVQEGPSGRIEGAASVALMGQLR